MLFDNQQRCVDRVLHRVYTTTEGGEYGKRIDGTAEVIALPGKSSLRRYFIDPGQSIVAGMALATTRSNSLPARRARLMTEAC